MVQSLCRLDLHELAKQRDYAGIGTKFASQLFVQMVEAISQFHQIGYLHRDIKPSNFVIRSRNNSEEFPEYLESLDDTMIVCLIDFGVARRFMNSDRSLRAPRQDGVPRFRGTNRYASIRNYQSKELGRCDDMISLYYSMLEITVPDGLPWRHISDKVLTCEMKKKLDVVTLHSKLNDEQFSELMDVLHWDMSQARYENEIDYVKYQAMATDIVSAKNSQQQPQSHQ